MKTGSTQEVKDLYGDKIDDEKEVNLNFEVKNEDHKEDGTDLLWDEEGGRVRSRSSTDWLDDQTDGSSIIHTGRVVSTRLKFRPCDRNTVRERQSFGHDRILQFTRNIHGPLYRGSRSIRKIVRP